MQRPDSPTTPQFTGDETFFEALFAGSSVKFAEIAAKAARGEPLAAVSIPMKVTITIDNTFEVVSEQLTRNVVGMVEGSDPALRNTYVLFGAHLDHVGYSQTGGGGQPTPSACRSRSAASQARVTGAGKTLQNQGRRGGGRGASTSAPAKPFDERDIISNGADDDGSGSAAMMAIAKAFATGPRPKRSVVFIWHTGEEGGLAGAGGAGARQYSRGRVGARAGTFPIPHTRGQRPSAATHRAPTRARDEPRTKSNPVLSLRAPRARDHARHRLGLGGRVRERAARSYRHGWCNVLIIRALACTSPG